MIYKEITIHTTSEGSEIVQGMLIACGIDVYTVEDPNDLEDLLENKSIPFDYVEDDLLARRGGETLIKAYLEPNEQYEMRLSALKEAVVNAPADIDMGSMKIEIGDTADEDWVNGWREYFKPLYIGKSFIVKPSWEECEVLDEQHVIEIDPESSFGTGQHETTALCLEALEDIRVNGKRVLDMGCGSGILGIGALCLDAASVLAVDIEQTAADTSVANAKKNFIDMSKYSALWGNVLTDEALREKVLPHEHKYDIVLINIVADVIMAMLPLIAKSLRGTIVCSGVLAERRPEVSASLESNGFRVVSFKDKNDWSVIIAEKE